MGVTIQHARIAETRTRMYASTAGLTMYHFFWNATVQGKPENGSVSSRPGRPESGYCSCCRVLFRYPDARPHTRISVFRVPVGVFGIIQACRLPRNSPPLLSGICVQ